VFARKLIRPVGGDQNDIELGIANEERVIEKVSASGGHPNIIGILRHGWLNIDEKYFLDMELCAMNLGDFISGDFAMELGEQYFDPMSNGNGPRCLTIWNIMRDIISGLEYLHGQREVHRDLKPQNGIPVR
jgi:serine/threonine protein kinase